MWMQMLLRLLQQLDWNYIAIVYDDDAYGRQAAEELRDLSKGQDLCVPSFTALPLDYRYVRFSLPLDYKYVRFFHAPRLQVCAFSLAPRLQVCAFSLAPRL